MAIRARGQTSAKAQAAAAPKKAAAKKAKTAAKKTGTTVRASARSSKKTAEPAAERSAAQSDKAAAPRLRERLRETITQEILTAAEATFAERGVSTTSMADIAARAGMAVGTLYNYFADREAMLRALQEQRRIEFLRAIDDSLESSAALPFRAQLALSLRALFAVFSKHRNFAMMMIRDERSVFNPSPSKRSAILEFLARYEVLTQRGLAEQALRPDFAPLLPTMLSGVVRGALLYALYSEQPVDLLDLVEPVVRLIMEGAAPRDA